VWSGKATVKLTPSGFSLAQWRMVSDALKFFSAYGTLKWKLNSLSLYSWQWFFLPFWFWKMYTSIYFFQHRSGFQNLFGEKLLPKRQCPKADKKVIVRLSLTMTFYSFWTDRKKLKTFSFSTFLVVNWAGNSKSLPWRAIIFKGSRNTCHHPTKCGLLLPFFRYLQLFNSSIASASVSSGQKLT